MERHPEPVLIEVEWTKDLRISPAPPQIPALAPSPLTLSASSQNFCSLSQTLASYILTFLWQLQKPKRSSTLLWGFAILVVVLAAYLYVRNSRDAVKVHAATVTREDLISTISTNGKVEPLEDFQAHAPAPGTIEDLYVSVGDHVAKGQKLMLLDSADAAKQVAAANAGLQSSEASLANMQAGGTQDERLSATADMNNAVARAAAGVRRAQYARSAAGQRLSLRRRGRQRTPETLRRLRPRRPAQVPLHRPLQRQRPRRPASRRERGSRQRSRRAEQLRRR